MRVKRLPILLLPAILLFTGCKGNEPVAPRLKIMKTSQADDYSGDVTVDYVIYHQNSKPVALTVEYSLDSGASWQAVTEGTNSSGITGLLSSRKGAPYKLVWATATDMRNSSRVAKLRFISYTFDKGAAEFGQPVETSAIKVRNFTMGSLGCVAVLAPADNDTDALSPSIAALRDGGVAAVWESGNSTDSVIQFAGAPADSVVFGAPVPVNPAHASPAAENSPDIGADPKGGLYAVWTEPVSGYRRLRFSFSYDNGAAWSEPKGISYKADLDETDPRLMVSGNSSRVARATGAPGGDRNIFFSYSPGSGIFYYETRVNVGFGSDIFDHQSPDLVRGNSAQVVCAWIAQRGQKRYVWTSLAHNEATWEWAKLVSDGESTAPTGVRLCADAWGAIHAVWIDNREGEPRIYGSTSYNGGYSWTANRNLIDNASGVEFSSPDMVADGTGQLVLFWIDNSSGTREVYAATSLDKGFTYEPPVLMSQDKPLPGAECISLRAAITPDGVPVCAFVEESTFPGRYHIRFARAAK
ncbi:MAG: hypothetical protein E3J72_13745 [Planctomycetota bacterium]|nr:MAG: hypothetical protein E3J72_13745 [Planctomycetota bacterium]